jgi:predicted small metal-binding protein
MPSFKSRDIGLTCPFEGTGATVDKINGKMQSMPGSAHQMKMIPHEVLAKVEKQLKK